MNPTEFRSLLEAGNPAELRRAWAPIHPSLTREAAEALMHRTRTEAETVSMKARAWSHRWLIERDLPSGLPDRLRPSAEQMCPVVKESVGIAVGFRSPFMKGAEPLVVAAMSRAVEDAYAEGQCGNSPFISARMAEAKQKEMKALFGHLPGNG